MHNRVSSLIFSGKLQELKDVDNSPIVGGVGGIYTVVDTIPPQIPPGLHSKST